MSLLMDALKKAEQEKKEAAKRLQKTGHNPLVETGEHLIQTGVSPDITGPHEIQSGSDSGLSLEPIDSQTQEDFSDTSENEVVQADNTSEMRVTDMTQEDKVTTESDLHEDTEEMEAMGEPRRRLREMEITLDDTIDDTLEEQLPYRDELTDEMPEAPFNETLDSVTAAQLISDIGSDGQPTPVAASTIFEASRGTDWFRNTRVALFVVLLAAVLITGGTLIHLKTTPTVRDMPSPLVAKGVEKPLTNITAFDQPAVTSDAVTAEIETSQDPSTLVEEPVQPLEQVTSEVAEAEEDAVEIVSEAESIQAEPQVAMVMEPVDTALTLSEEVSGPEPVTEVSVEEPPLREAAPAPAVESEPVAMVEPSVASSEGAGLAETQGAVLQVAAVEPAMFKISRSKTKPVQNEFNLRAYAAYQAGNYDVAESMYRTTLDKYPDNRDALLGLAAIAVHNGRFEEAYLRYRQVLRLNPKDASARLALVNLRGRVNPLANESLVKLMLQERPGTPELYFSLGNQYASQLRWAEAQQAFFEAYSRSNDNPDYALNLAVSLDHMGQKKAALEYYHTALQLADRYPANFNTTSVMSRVKTLSETTDTSS